MRPGLEPLTDRLKTLPLDDRGYPVPWFVAWIDGKPDFRTSDQKKWVAAIQDNLCWVCGQKMGAFKTFVIGPMCGVNRTTSEPGNHLDCALWSARNCPFLCNPNMIRNERNLVGDNPGGIMIKRNPGLCLLWTTKKFKVFKAYPGYLLKIGEPMQVLFFAEGKPATREQIDDAVNSGCPLLEAVAMEDGREGHEQFKVAKYNFLKLIDQHTGETYGERL